MPNNVGIQLQKAIALKESVQEFAINLDRKMNDLNDQLSYYVRIGFPEDIADTYKWEYLSKDESIISDLSNKMRKDHVEFLDEIIENLRGAGNVR